MPFQLLARLACCLATLFASMICARAADDVQLSICGDRFSMNDKPQFLVLVSYFDALRAADETIESDFAWLEKNGINGVRIFPNWWDQTADGFPKDTLMTSDGSLQPERLKKLETVLKTAATHGLIVDVSIAYEVVPGLSTLKNEQVGTPQGQLPVNQVKIDALERALVTIAKKFRAYHHWFLDIQNEFNGRVTHLGDEEVLRLITAVKGADAQRILTASLANEIGPEDVARRSESDKLDVIAWHESRNPWQFEKLDELARRAKVHSQKPLYFGEPASMEDTGLGADAFLTAVCNVKRGGAAAWTFHTEHGFDLRTRSFRDQLTPNEQSFLKQVASKLGAIPWGVSAK